MKIIAFNKTRGIEKSFNETIWKMLQKRGEWVEIGTTDEPEAPNEIIEIKPEKKTPEKKIPAKKKTPIQIEVKPETMAELRAALKAVGIKIPKTPSKQTLKELYNDYQEQED